MIQPQIWISYNVIFFEKITETINEGLLINSFINSRLNSETSQNIRFSQIGDITINSEKSIVSTKILEIQY